MSLVLLNLKSSQQIKLDNDTPLVIGRGTLTGCSDKRVSRNHVKITCKDGKINLVALHTNPCFFTRNGVPPVHQLLKNEEETLKEGDCIGLLPNAFWFVIASNETVKIKLEKQDSENNSTTNRTEGENSNVAVINESVKSEKYLGVVNSKDVTEGSVSPKPGTSNCVPDQNSETPTKNNTSKGLDSPELQKTRRLPLWMYEIDEPKEIKQSPIKRAFGGAQEKTSKKPKISEDKKDTGNKSPKVCEIKVENVDLDLPSTSDFVQNDECKTTSTSCDSVSKQNSVNEHSKETDKKGLGSDTNDSRRPICQYEGNCYRQNPNHKESFSHPGDPDFIPYEDRPMCQYGAACYRKNERHRVEYRHPATDESAPSSPSSQSGSIASSPLPAKRKRKPTKKKNSDHEDEYDLDDPFINDASSDEYVPSNQSSEEELDTSFQDD